MALLISALMYGMHYSPQTAHAEAQHAHLYDNQEAQADFIKGKIREYFPEDVAEAMIAVANCESTGLIHWRSDGTLIRNKPKKGKKATSAKGVLQILFSLHRPDYTRLGLNMKDIDDYMRYGRHLYETQGPENAWKECTVQMPKSVLAALR